MSTKSGNKSILNDLRNENKRISKDLNECHKRIDFLQKFIINYRKILVQISHKCVCNHSNDIINSIKSIEFQYKDLFFNDNKEDQRKTSIVDNDYDSEEESDFIDDNVDEEEDNEESVDDEIDVDLDQTDAEESDELESIGQQTDDNCIENNETVLVFNISNDTIIKKRCDDIDTNHEIIIKPLVIKRAENLIDEAVDEVINRCKESETNECCAEINAENHEYNTKSVEYSGKQPLLSLTTEITVSSDDKHEERVLLPIRSSNNDNVQHFIEKVEPKKQTSFEDTEDHRIWRTIQIEDNETEVQNILTVISTIDGKVETLISEPVWPLGSLNSSKKYFDIFNSLIAELRSGRVESFIDPKHQLITVFLRSVESTDGQNLSEIIFKCNYTDCQYESNSKKYIRSHILRHEKKNKQFICQMCKQEFVSKVSFIEHRIERHNIDTNRLFKCLFPGCLYKTTIRQSFEWHSVTHQTERTVKCDTDGCETYFKSYKQMKNHQKTVHVLRDFQCQWPGCEASFKTRPAMKTHVMSHTGENKSVAKIRDLITNGNYFSIIDQNNDMFSVIRQQVINEIDGSIGMGPKFGYKCNYAECKFVCVLPHLIEQHINTHIIGNTFKCHFCDKAFGLRKYWTQHQKNIHNVNNSRPVLCCQYQGCDYQTKRVYCMKSHSLRHQTERPFKCDENGCEKRFKEKVCLKQHMIYCHTKVKPFVCEFAGCQSAFKMRTNLSRHLRSHSKTKSSHRCDSCSKSFKSKQLLNKHLKIKH